MKTTEKDNDDPCPICWSTAEEVRNQEIPLALTPCGHSACLTCIENVLLVRTDIPGYGTCPICRSEIRLFDLMVEVIDNYKTGDVHSQRLLQSYQDRTTIHGVNLKNSTLYGQIVYTREGGPGAYSMHFPKEITCINSSDNSNIDIRPYISCTALSHEKMDDGTNLPDILYFEPGYYWHDRSKTFHGRISWSNSSGGVLFKGSDYWDVILQVSSDARYVCGGGIIKNMINVFPLDGKWTVVWSKNETQTDIDVENGFFQVFNTNYRIQLDKQNTPYILWPDSDIKQEALSGINLDVEPGGPPIGGTIVWQHNDESTGEIVWYRRSIAKRRPIINYFGGENRGRTTYLIREEGMSTANPSNLMKYVSGTIWGNSFLQLGRFGVASYHFISELGGGLDGAYISYESSECAVWPPLDDGSPVPARVPFSYTSWDVASRTFRGKVEWQRMYGSTWQGDALWDYEMNFCPNYLAIVSGFVKSSPSIAPEMFQVKNEYGQSLIYINGRSSEKILSSVSKDEVLRIFRHIVTYQSLENIDVNVFREMIENGASMQHLLLILRDIL